MTKPAVPVPLLCSELPPLEATDLDRVRAAFSGAPACALRQHWRPALEPDFQPGRVQVGWQPNALLILAELTDRDIYTTATDHQQRLWTLGDTFEVFVQPEGGESYAEFHVAPNNRRLALRFPRLGAHRTAAPEEFMVRGRSFSSAVWVRPETPAWWVLAEIPAATVGQGVALRPGMAWRFSFSRYDYTRGRQGAVLSSSSRHAALDFHRLHEWGTLRFEGRPA